MDGWMDGCIRMDGWMDGCMHACMHVCMVPWPVFPRSLGGHTIGGGARDPESGLIYIYIYSIYFVLIDVLLVIGTIAAAYCQETTKAKRTRSQKQGNSVCKTPCR